MIYLHKEIETVQGVTASFWMTEAVKLDINNWAFDEYGVLDVDQTTIAVLGILRLWKDPERFIMSRGDKNSALDFVKFRLVVPLGGEVTPDDPTLGMLYVLGSILRRIVTATKLVQSVDDDGSPVVDDSGAPIMEAVPLEFMLERSKKPITFSDAVIVSA